MSRYSNFTEEDYRPRPNRRGSRPRTKDRPDYSDALIGFVFSVDRGRYRVALPDGTRVTGVRASHLRRKPIVPGDRVRVVGDTSGQEGTLARIVEIEPRTTVLRRTADDIDPTERVLVANADQLVIVTATADPDPSEGLIDRTLIAAFDAGIEPILAITKLDIKPADQLRQRFADTGVTIVECGFDSDGNPRVEELRKLLAGHVSVLVGHSGVGKSTLMNALVPHVERATGSVNEVTGRGRHTSSSALGVPFDDGGWLIDTPGVRSFGLAHVTPETVLSAFAELAPATAQCPRGCSHMEDSPGCALDQWVKDGKAGDSGPDRLMSLRRLLSNLAATPQY